MKIAFSDRAWEQYVFWQAQDRRMLARINALIESATRTPFAGIGKPEPLRGSLSGYWSRRIDHEHRLVYKVGQDMLLIAQCRYHY